jgi:hypothetical protein
MSTGSSPDLDTTRPGGCLNASSMFLPVPRHAVRGSGYSAFLARMVWPNGYDVEAPGQLLEGDGGAICENSPETARNGMVALIQGTRPIEEMDKRRRGSSSEVRVSVTVNLWPPSGWSVG